MALVCKGEPSGILCHRAMDRAQPASIGYRQSQALSNPKDPPGDLALPLPTHVMAQAA
jgi:hypothetical protein